MKKIITVLAVLIVVLCGCTSEDVTAARKIDDYSFELTEDEKDYNLRFAICDKDGNYLSMNAKVDIRIVNSMGETVYKATKSFKKSDFDYYETQKDKNAFLANVRVKGEDITPGRAFDGTAYFKVYKEGEFAFAETACEILYILPTKDFKITAEKLPLSFKYYNRYYPYKLISKIVVENVDFRVDFANAPGVLLILSGKKTFGISRVDVDSMDYEVYDNSGKIVTYGNISLRPCAAGDEFQDESVVLMGLVPGEEYKIRFTKIK